MRAWNVVRVQLRQPAMLVFAANMMRSALAFLVTLVVARGLGPAEFGLFTTFVVVTTLAHNLIGEGFDPSVVRLYARKRHDDPTRLPQVLGSAIGMRALLVLPMLLLILLGGRWLAPALGDVLQLASLTAVAASFATLSLAVLQARERFVAYALLMPLTNALRLLFLPVLALAGALTLAPLMWTHALSFALAGVLGLWLLRNELRRARLDLATIRELFRFGKWTALANLSFVLQINLAVPVLTLVKGAAQAGLYSAAATLLLVVDQFTAALLTVNLPSTSRIQTATELRAFAKRLAPRLLSVGLALSLLVPLSGQIIALAFGPAYAESATVMRVLLPGFIATLLSHPLYLVLYTSNRPHWYTGSGVVALAAWCALAWWLIPPYGVVGAAWATTISRVLQALLISTMVLHTLVRRPTPPPDPGRAD
ncbi:oligosaccharide flippase family protein [Accumulibacter sp.]|uniref:oligosaccharide flippase family protein n=1 Tax=Accumulibacter sp. TaxID=2053492 RepID=UPI0025FDB50F|nr:oligosaccharide flippase family protein [Accumulibacter sp.]MCP5229423.1 oligosaccharide flippase family protein [Accumulibacter sp.]